MLISFICLCYNQEKEILRTIKSIVFSKINYEIIIIDDCSTDNSIDNIKQLIEKGYNIKLIKKSINTKNQSKYRNEGIKISKGEYIAFVDGDDYLNPFEIKKIYDMLLKRKIDIISPMRLIGQEKNYKKLIWKLSDNKNYCNGISHYIIRKEIIFKDNIYFEEKEYNYWAEDLYFYCLLFQILINKKYSIKYFYSDYYYFGIKRVTSTFYKKKLDQKLIIYFLKYERFINNEIKNKLIKKYCKHTCLKMIKIIKESKNVM